MTEEPTTLEPYIRLVTLCKATGRSKPFFLKHIHDGNLPAYNSGRGYAVKHSDFVEFEQEHMRVRGGKDPTKVRAARVGADRAGRPPRSSHE